MKNIRARIKERTAPARANHNKSKSDPATTTCPDGHKCHHHSECVENPNDESQYFCDCDASALLWDEAFAGLSCEHKATEYCKHDPSMFCTNGGACHKTRASDGTKYTECRCANGYEGNYCQFVAGSAPQDWPTDAASKVMTSKHHGQGGMGTGGIVAIVVVSLALVSAIGFLAWRYLAMKEETRGVLDDFADMEVDSMHGGKNKKAKASKKEHELELDADGGKLKEAMKEADARDANYDMENEDGPVKEMI